MTNQYVLYPNLFKTKMSWYTLDFILQMKMICVDIYSWFDFGELG